MKLYAGIGSRNTPHIVLVNMALIALKLEGAGWTLNSGGAKGADSAFAKGAGTNVNIYIPWKSYNGLGQHIRSIVITNLGPLEDYRALAQEHHPNWSACSQGARLLHTRNSAIILHPEPVKFVLCWFDPLHPGGTGQGIRLALSRNIPVFNMYYPDWLNLLTDLVKENG